MRTEKQNGHSSQRNARNEHAQKRLTATRTSLRGSAKVARTKVVSWLRAVRLTFPAAPAVSGVRVDDYCPLQWRGRTRIVTGSLAPPPGRLFFGGIYFAGPSPAAGSSMIPSPEGGGGANPGGGRGRGAGRGEGA